MSFWIITVLFTLVAASCVLLPLVRKPDQIIEGIDHDKALYHQRLKEIDKDETLNRISSQEAEAARSEEGRRLIAISNSTVSMTNSRKFSHFALLGFVATLAVPIIAFSIYLQIGKPTMQDQSLASRLEANPSEQPVEELLARAEAHLAKSPNDARGWSVIAPVYTRTGRYDDAVRAWSNVLRLSPQYPEVRSLLGEAILATTDGVINDKSFELFEDELKANPASARARYYIATGLGQLGKNNEAAQAWETLLNGANPQAPWYKTAFANMNEQRQKAGLEIKSEEELASAKTIPGPTKEQIEDAAQLSDEDRASMIEGMVSNLAEKLKEDPSDKESWQRLIRAYTVLGRNDDALSAIETALLNHKDDAEFSKIMNDQKANLLK